MLPTRVHYSPLGAILSPSPGEKEIQMCRTSWARCRPHRSFSGSEFGHHGDPRHFGWGGAGGGGEGMSYPGGGDEGAGAFGVRRPLRFLAHKLQLDDAQVAQLARILD